MRAAIGLLALASAAAAFLIGTEKGRQLTREMGPKLRDAYDDARARFGPGLDGTVTRALEEPHPDTAVARAFEEAVA